MKRRKYLNYKYLDLLASQRRLYGYVVRQFIKLFMVNYKWYKISLTYSLSIP